MAHTLKIQHSSNLHANQSFALACSRSNDFFVFVTKTLSLGLGLGLGLVIDTVLVVDTVPVPWVDVISLTV